MELRHLRYFVAVAEAENFHRAAETLNVSQSPLSRQIQQLEREIGVELFEPAGRGVKLTLSGRVFCARAKAILATVDGAVEEAREATTGTIGSIAIGFGSGATYAGALSRIVAQFRTQRPRVAVKLVSMSSPEQWEALRRAEIDFAYGNYAPDDSSLRSIVLARTRIGMLLPRDHRLAAKAKLKVVDLANEPVIMAPRKLHPRMHDDIIAAVRAHGIVLNLTTDVVDREALWTLVASGLGVTFAGERTASFLDAGGRDLGSDPPDLGSAVWRPFSDLGVELCDVAMWRADAARSPLVHQLIEIAEAMRAQLRKSARSA